MFSEAITKTIIFDRLAGGRDGSQYSPDIWKLEQFEYQLLFVPDIFMSRHPMHSVINNFVYGGRPIGSGFTQESYWGFWKYKLGKASYPIAMINRDHRNTYRNRVGRIKGEVYAIRPYMFIDLDNWYRNKVEFIRHRTSILNIYRRKIIREDGEVFISPEIVEVWRCWMYVGIPEVWNDILDGGMNFSPVAMFDPKPQEDRWTSGPYFYWSLNEYEEQYNSTKTYSLSQLPELGRVLPLR